MKNKKLLSIFVFGTIFCILTGFICFGLAVFNLQSPLFQFIPYGIVGSLSFYLFQSGRTRDIIFVNILLFVLLYFISGHHFFFTHLLYYAAVVFSIYFFSYKIYKKMNKLVYARPLVLAGLFSIFFVLVDLILTFVYYSESTHIMPFKNMPIGFLIGLGLGSGFELSEYFYSGKK